MKPAAVDMQQPLPPSKRVYETQVTLADFRAAVTRIFHRYDLDGSGTCNSTDELRQMSYQTLYQLSTIKGGLGSAFPGSAALDKLLASTSLGREGYTLDE